VKPLVRGYRPDDLDAVYDVCVRTGDRGAGAVGRYRSDRLLGELYAGPYLTAEPEHAHVLDDGTGRVVGYLLGTADTARFVRWYREVWLSVTADRCPPPADPPLTPDDVLLARHRRPERMLVPVIAEYPAHLHINLLAPWRGRGWGRVLMERFLAGLRTAGVPAVHLATDVDNRPALAFYRRLDFERLEVPDRPDVAYLGRSTSTRRSPEPPTGPRVSVDHPQP
jgi:ribosomal protein S18 acetylase RimI-like enzyme